MNQILLVVHTAVRLLATLLLVVNVGVVFADVTAVTVTPTTRPVSANQPTVLNIVWQVTRDPLGGLTVSSTRGEFAFGSSILGVVPTALTRTQAASNTQYVFTETVTVPPHILQRAQKLGLPGLVYVRSFTDGLGDSVGFVLLAYASPAATGFSVHRQALYYDDRAAIKIIDPGERLRATAEITFGGTGLLQGVWEIADPATTAGEPIFRTISSVRQHLAGETVKLESPLLPTDSTGVYLVRFRITDPAVTFDMPVIQYFVSARQGSAPRELVVHAPVPGAVLAADTAFSWQRVPNARAYQLLVYAASRTTAPYRPDAGAAESPAAPSDLAVAALKRAPVTGVLVPAARTRATLAPATRAHLESGATYVWRVQAIDANGAVIAESPARTIVLP